MISRPHQKTPSAIAGHSPDTCSRWPIFVGGAVLVVTTLAAYHNSFSGPFIFDDPGSVTENPTIRHFASAFFPPAASTTSGRPFPNLTLALNFALNDTNPRGYHVLNLLIHTLAGLTLFGVLRRTFLKPRLVERFKTDALPLALAIAALWTLHPLQTEAVTYISQRAESLMGLCYLFTLYAFIRGTTSPTPSRWHALAIFSCLLGMASKEVMVSAPLIVLLYDRTFVAGTFKQALAKSPRFYAGLACTWVLLAVLVLNAGNRNGTAGFNTIITPWNYLLTQCDAIAHYLKLTVWPNPLIFDHGSNVVQSTATVIFPGTMLLALLAGTAIALRRWPVAGFAGAWFFAILAPSSSIVPVATQTMAEHRMYLPLAAVICAILFGLHAWLGRRTLFVAPVLVVGLGMLTYQRNQDYQSELALWSDTVAKCPANARAHNNLGLLLTTIPGRTAEAISHYETALKLRPDYALAHDNLGLLLGTLPNRSEEAIAHHEAALALKPDFALAHNNLGLLLEKTPGRMADAIAHYEAALRSQPDFAEAHSNLGFALTSIPKRTTESIDHFEKALRLKPDDEKTHNNLGLVLAKIPGRSAEAIRHFEAALHINPAYAKAHNNLGLMLAAIPERQPEAIAHFEESLRLNPNDAETHNNLGGTLANIPGRMTDAKAHFEAAVKINPDFAMARRNLALVNELLAR